MRGGVIALVVLGVGAQCPNSCSHQGHCDKFGVCSCFRGFRAADCSEKTCPFDYAWSDVASGDDSGHAKAECSNRGNCDRGTGQCECMDGFGGRACERLNCDFDCYGRGKCLSMRHLARTSYSGDLSEQFSYEEPWDADKIFGCVCDEPYAAFNCGLRDCPSGDDPLTTGQVNEKQLLKCMATGGTFAFYFRGKATGTIKSEMQEEDVEAALTETETIDEVSVSFSAFNGTVCQSETTNVVTIEFTQNFGSLPPLKPEVSNLAGTLIVYADGATQVADAKGVRHRSVKGTKEDDQCSNRGLCDPFTATCGCMTTNNDVYASSDGYGGKGARGDCGRVTSSNGIASCPGEVPCSDNGVCDTSTFRCYCKDGWFGADCSLRSCPKGPSWFSYPSADNEAHSDLVTCSNGGTCDTATGYCTCGDQFFGAACEYFACPTGSTASSTCSAHGRCVSMSELARLATDNGDATNRNYGSDVNDALTWDADRVYGCACDPGFTGYDCSLRTCPFGDDPGTYNQENELQTLTCAADSGTFTLTFRQATTAPIAFDATAADLEKAIESISTVTDLEVTYSSGAAACATANTVSLQFVTEHGDLPLVTADVFDLEDSTTGTTGVITIASAVDGTTENQECSNRGLCDRATGACVCFDGYSSSDGKGNKGTQGDCGHRELCNAAWCGSNSEAS